MDLVYESDDGQLYHGCKEVYKASKCRNCYETFEFSDNESSDDEGSGSDCDDDCKKHRRPNRFSDGERSDNERSDCEDDECKKKKKVHRNYKRGGYGSERRQSDCESDCERSERCNYPFCELYEDNCDLLLTLCDGVLHDDRHATGEIVANHQFQFDKPPQKDALHKRDFPLFTLMVITIWLLTTRSNSGIVKLMTMDYTRSTINLLVNNVAKLNLLF